MLLSSCGLMLLSVLGNLLLLSPIIHVNAEPKVISMETKRMSRSALHKRDEAEFSIRNGIVLYIVDVVVGTPSQNIALQIDTTNHDTWLPGPELASDLTVAAGGIYYPTASDSKSNSSDSGFEMSNVQGGFITDDLTIGSYKLHKLRMGLAQETDFRAGQLGLGMLNMNVESSDDETVAVKNSTVLDSMFANGLIKRRAYSLWLNTVDSDKGSIIFGGVDTEKYEGDLKWLHMSSTTPAYAQVVGMSYTFGQTTIATPGMANQTNPDAEQLSSTTTSTEEASATKSPAASDTVDRLDDLAEALDFGSTFVHFDTRAYVSMIPDSIFYPLAELLGAAQIGDSQLYTVPCSFDKEGSIGFQFDNLVDGPVINIPFSELAFPIPDWMQPGSGSFTLDEEENSACGFGLTPLGGEWMMVLGQTFLRSAYIVFDHDNKTVGLASARWNVTGSNIVEITEDGHLGLAITDTAASASATASVADNQPSSTLPVSATNVGQPSSATSALENGATTSSVASGEDHESKPTSTDSGLFETSPASAGAGPAVTEQSTVHLALFVLCGSIFLVAAMFL